MKASRITALGLVAAAALWIWSGHLLPRENAESDAAIRTSEAEGAKLFRVGVAETSLVPHSRKLVLSGRTEADRRVTLTARTGGVLTELRVRRGSAVKAGDIVAILSDEARQSQVAQARSLVMQRQAELEAKRPLIASGANPKLDLVNLQSQLDASKAALASAEAELDRGIVRAPWAGVVSDTMVEVGKAAFSMAGADICTIVALDPMLAVVEVSERRLAGLKVGDSAQVRLITGVTASGKVRFVSKTASQTTRTYRLEIELPNADGAIPDGISADVTIPLAPDRGDQRAALGAHVLVDRRSRGAHRRSRRPGRLPAGQCHRGRADRHVGRRHSGRRTRDRAGTGLRARRPARRGGSGGAIFGQPLDRAPQR